MRVDAVLVVLAVALHVAAAAAGGGPHACPPYGQEVYWNVGGIARNWTFGEAPIIPGTQTQTGNSCSNPGCKSWTQGMFPTITGVNKDGTFKLRNGGVPQAGDLTMHLDLLKKQVVDWIPDPDWNGNAVLDFEQYTPSWEQNTSPGYHWHGKDFQTLSIQLVQKAHPNWPKNQVIAQAKMEFEAATVKWFAETLTTLRAMRPKAKWGYYGLPMNYDDCTGTGASTVCGYNSKHGKTYKQYNRNMAAVWAASSALFPSIYLPGGRKSGDPRNAAYINATVAESVELAAVAGDIPVYAFIMPQYHNETTLISYEDSYSQINLPRFMGARGVVLWGGAEVKRFPQFASFVNETYVPIANKVTADACECSQMLCKGKGRCVQPTGSKSIVCEK